MTESAAKDTPKPGSRASEAGDDVPLMEKVAARDPSALKALYDRYGPTVLSLSLRMLRDRAAAEEVLQDVFLEVWNRPVRE